jgi:AcrR family transcriptional regulator
MSLRKQYAEETRKSILRAARTLFAERGYVKTRVEDIATLAGVAAVTVYTSAGGKSGILQALVDIWTTSPIRSAATESIQLSQDPLQVMAIAGRIVCSMREEFADIIYAIQDAAPYNDAVATNLKIATQRYRGSCLMIAEKLESLGALRSDLSVTRARDVLWFYFGYWSLFTLHDENEWSYADAERWLIDAASHAILKM